MASVRRLKVVKELRVSFNGNTTEAQITRPATSEVSIMISHELAGPDWTGSGESYTLEIEFRRYRCIRRSAKRARLTFGMSP